ncbi:hypothetical protein LB534_25415 [Mesorhizobium sp. CA18]|uniref:hypothetical protein n=1 Tax=unclassified Mesorhizobium TaxID=325217 RepID=UPI001CCB719C|nr:MULTISPECIES: hypothetical protein [unclassified Mesorhizobium]MBZ9735184.1 hypothetical protein [Mesorhizobium sp. CA9]MBZ9828641.1 hypothetical protein [Mesorhizobium sp. CA18]MBZ9833043.1 hypothetical protein [Mesorhizobium sp. CA2]MBZ9839484.1 hypothetical protein [Mesorhizobium sp. CA3]MBZ9879654.1 hypothetical protein [Mesorhizobium sp. Ca11]
MYLTANPTPLTPSSSSPAPTPIEGRIDGFRQVQCGIAGQILGGGETPSISHCLVENSTPAFPQMRELAMALTGMSAPISSAGVPA